MKQQRVKPTAKESRFAQEYLLDCNGAQAAVRAGYSARGARQTARKLLQRPRVQQALRAEMEARSARVRVDADQVLRELWALAFARITDVVELRDGKLELRDLGQLTDEQRAAIEAVEETKHGWRVRLHSKERALELLMRHLGMLVERREVSGPGGEPIALERTQRGLTEDTVDFLRRHILGIGDDDGKPN